MFNFESIVDAVSSAQKQVVETFVVDKKVQAEVVKVVEAQAKFTKTTYKTALEATEGSIKYFNDSIKALATKKAGV